MQQIAVTTNENGTSGAVYISNSQGLEIDCTWQLENDCIGARVAN